MLIAGPKLHARWQARRLPECGCVSIFFTLDTAVKSCFDKTLFIANCRDPASDDRGGRYSGILTGFTLTGTHCRRARHIGA
jgi:hypothetical protein